LGTGCFSVLVEEVSAYNRLTMPKVLRIINRLNLGGPTYNAAYLTKYLEPEFETLLVAGMKDDSEESSEFIVEALGIKPVFISDMKREISFKSDWKAYKQIDKIIKEFKPDIVHTHAAKAGTLGRIAAWRNGVPVIVHTFHGHVFHSYFGYLKTTLFKWIERFLSSISTCIIAISDLQKQELCNLHKICSERKTRVVPLGFDLDRFHHSSIEIRSNFRKKFDLPEDAIAIGIIGRLVPIKNHPMFLKAFAMLKNQTSHLVKAVIVGDGEDRKALESLCVNLGLRISTIENPQNDFDVVFTSWIHEVETALAGCDIIAMTSLNEGTPVSLIEAQAAGKPIVSTAVGGIENVVLPDQTALLSASMDVEAFSNNLKKLVESSELRNAFSEMGWSFVSQKFHFKRLATDMAQLYNRLLKNLK
jgi:glycosyltransferase involved in cell wall biosynthesis